MTSPYDLWISDYVRKNNGFVRGKCLIACKEMRLAFPELVEVSRTRYLYLGEGRACVVNNTRRNDH